jgi:hypothetical protein
LNVKKYINAATTSRLGAGVEAWGDCQAFFGGEDFFSLRRVGGRAGRETLIHLLPPKRFAIDM